MVQVNFELKHWTLTLTTVYHNCMIFVSSETLFHINFHPIQIIYIPLDRPFLVLVCM